MGQFWTTVRKNTGWQIRKIVNKKMDKDQNGGAKGKEDGKKNQWPGYRGEYNDQLLKVYDESLKKNNFLTGEQITFVDIIVYCEIETIIKMTRETIPVYYAALSAWYDKISELAAIKHCNSELAKIIDDNQLIL